jgi:hypothetical protein
MNHRDLRARMAQLVVAHRGHVAALEADLSPDMTRRSAHVLRMIRARLSTAQPDSPTTPTASPGITVVKSTTAGISPARVK